MSGDAALTSRTGFCRRDVFHGLLAFAAATVLPQRAWAAAAAGSFVSPGQTAFLAAFVDTLIPATDTPGAKAAGVHLGLVGLLGRWASAKTRAGLLVAIAALQADLDRRAGAPFATARPAARLAALSALDAEAFASPRPAGLKDYRTLKSLAVRLYYTSEIGASQELRYDPLPEGYTGNLPFKPGDRAWAL
ncbi:gluconate 2-dehydrogenase subunit 3 family protein [Glacieibacterium frigidum]|uniref:Gluconate 2-dehydrogenase subunit 3 family protein n=1 Tax=Glacieibacterium frigidum TaxID=2593303 RepID=A0A552UGI0_9SPHN|nr:gluconate 2-dehydrogenase subunit 3 family protein [Glacieibacterium frigidum]